MTQPLSVAVLGLLVGWVPPAHHAFLGETEDVTTWRYARIADDVALVAEEAPIAAPDGGDGARWTAALLGAVASLESALRLDVDRCERRSTRGAVTLWQLLGRAETMVCTDRQYAARQAREELRRALATCHAPADPLSPYTMGSCGHNREARHWMARAIAGYRRMGR